MESSKTERKHSSFFFLWGPSSVFVVLSIINCSINKWASKYKLNWLIMIHHDWFEFLLFLQIATANVDTFNAVLFQVTNLHRTLSTHHRAGRNRYRYRYHFSEEDFMTDRVVWCLSDVWSVQFLIVIINRWRRDLIRRRVLILSWNCLGSLFATSCLVILLERGYAFVRALSRKDM